MINFILSRLPFAREAPASEPVPVHQDNGQNLPAALEILLSDHYRQERSQAYPDLQAALAELGAVKAIAQDLHQTGLDERALLLGLEVALAARLENYVPEAEYSSDKGRLGSVLADVRKLIETGGGV